MDIVGTKNEREHLTNAAAGLIGVRLTNQALDHVDLVD